jgi:hypothetical protein
MQRFATNVFIGASVVFGIIGIAFWITIPQNNESVSNLNHGLRVFLGIAASFVLSSFAVSVAGKYLSNGD